MTGSEACDFLRRLFQQLFDPSVPAEEVGRYFAPDYVQVVDGKKLDHTGVVNHARALKDVFAIASVTLEKVVADGATIASMHTVRAQKKSGERVEVKVFAFFEVENGLVRRTGELTHVVHGEAHDRDLGSRT